VGGSLAFFISTGLLFSFFYVTSGERLIIVVCISILLTLAEFILVLGLDNLVLPILAALAAKYLLS
jgi:dolichol kinase